MKYLLMVSWMLSALLVFGQQSELPMSEVELRRELPMSATEGKVVDGVYRYYKKGEQEPFTGILTANYPSGKILTKQNYVDGIGEGTWINYYENGNFREVGTYQQNKVEGAIKKYYENGELKATGTYREWRIRVGEWKYYDENGRLVKTVNHGKKGDYRDVEDYYQKGDITKRFYEKLLRN